MFRLFTILVVSFAFAYAKKPIYIAISIDKPPYVFGKSSKKGIEPDLIVEILHNSQYKPIFLQKPKKYLLNALYEKNRIDGVATIRLKDKKFFPSSSYISYQNYVITRTKDHIKLNSVEDLASLKFVSWQESYYDLGEKFYKLFNPIDGIYKESYNETYSQANDIKMFFSEKVDAIIMDKTIFNWYKTHLNNNESYTFHYLFKKSNDYPVVFRSKSIRDIFNKNLKKLKESARYDDIVEFYQKIDLEKLITYANLISKISAKFLFEKRDKDLKKILKKLFTHPNIKKITIQNNDGKLFLKLNKKLQNDEKIYPSNFIEKKIFYASNNEIEEVGTLKIYYSDKFLYENGILIPPLEEFNSFDDDLKFIINSAYEKTNLKKRLLLNRKEREYIKNKKTITVHNEKNWAPYNFNENGIPKGLVIDYMDLLAKKIGISIKYISGHSWSEFLNLLKTEQIDVISNIAYTKDREKFVNFTEPYMVSKKAIFSNIPNLKNLKDLNGRILAVPKNYYLEHYIKTNYPKIKIKTYRDIQDCLYSIINKEADALVENYAVVNYIIIKNGLDIKYVYIQDDKELSSQLRIGVRKSQKILRDILQKAQDSVTKKEFELLENRWFGLKNVLKQRDISRREEEYLRNKKSVKICINPNWKPIEFLEDGKPQGITIDIVKLILKRLRLEPDFIYTDSWIESQEFLKFKKCDILASAIKTPTRETYAKFTKPYISYDLGVITKNDKPLLYDLSSIKNKSFARKKGSGIAEMILKDFPNIKVILTNNMHQAFKLVRDDLAYFSIATLPVFLYNQKRYNLENLQISGYFNEKANLRIAVRDDNKLLLSSLNKTIDKISEDTIKAINDKWTSQKVIKEIDYTFALAVLIISLIIIFSIYFAYTKQKILKNQIESLNSALEKKIVVEIEKNRKKEKLMLHQNRLAQMGEIISMIAHQWRQPLNILSILNQTIYIKFKREQLDEKYMDEFEKKSKELINNMSKTIDDFRDFFKPTKDKEIFSINQSIIDTISLIKPSLEKLNIEIVFKESGKYSIKGYKNEFGQVLLNIINNAKDALKESQKTNKKIEVSIERSKGKLEIMVLDNANGVPKEIQDKIFEPYFSTKDKNGTGLGLYMAKIIIEEHLNGKIKVYTNENGTTFKIILKEKKIDT